MRVGWFAQSRKVDVASVRYRCFHMAWALHRLGVSSAVFSDARVLLGELSELDALVVVKRMDTPVIDIVTAAADFGKPVFLDICDDMLSLEYRRQARQLHRAVFRAVLPLIEAIVTTGPAMSERIRSYGFDVPQIFEVPDVAETRQSLAEVTAYAAWLENPAGLAEPELGGNAGSDPVEDADDAERGLGRFRRVLSDPIGTARRAGEALGQQILGRPIPPPRPAGTPVRIVWFGNHGAPHSNFGMLSLIGAASALRAVHNETPLELIVISNHQAKFDIFLSKLGVPIRYVPWTAQVVYEELEQADIALLTNGDDSFSSVKSANRALQAIACGVPVVASSSAALRELADCAALDDIEAGLRLYIRNPRAARSAIATGQALVREHYSTAVIGRLWLDILSLRAQRASTRIADPAQSHSRARLLFLIDSAADLPAFRPLVSEARRRAVEVLIMVTARAGSDSPDVLEYLIREDLLPTMPTAEELESGDARWLRAADAVILAAEPRLPEDRIAQALARLAQLHKVELAVASADAMVAVASSDNDPAKRATAILDDLVGHYDESGTVSRVN